MSLRAPTASPESRRSAARSRYRRPSEPLRRSIARVVRTLERTLRRFEQRRGFLARAVVARRDEAGRERDTRLRDFEVRLAVHLDQQREALAKLLGRLFFATLRVAERTHDAADVRVVVIVVAGGLREPRDRVERDALGLVEAARVDQAFDELQRRQPRVDAVADRSCGTSSNEAR